MKKITATYISDQVEYPLYLVRYGKETLEIEYEYKKKNLYQETIAQILIQLPVVIGMPAELVLSDIIRLAWKKLKEENIIGEYNDGSYYLKEKAD